MSLIIQFKGLKLGTKFFTYEIKKFNSKLHPNHKTNLNSYLNLMERT